LSDGDGYLSESNIEVQVGDGDTVDVLGGGWATGGLIFDGAGVTTGLTFDGDTALEYCGTVRDLRVRSQNGAARCITFNKLNHARVERCRLRCDDGAAVAFISTLVSELAHTLITTSGSATEGSVEVDRDSVDPATFSSTCFKWDHSRISGGDTTVGGLIINRTGHVTIIGGAIESCGIPIRVCHRSDDTYGSVTGFVAGIDLENPGNGNSFIELGAGLSSSAFVSAWTFQNVNGSPSGSTTIPHFIRATRTRALYVQGSNFSLPNGTSAFEFEGTANVGAVIEPHYQLFAASGVPWVRENDVQVKAAGSRVRWYMDGVPEGHINRATSINSASSSITGATGSCLMSTTQGGYNRVIIFNHASPTTVTALTDGEAGMRITCIALTANTTLTDGTSADVFNLVASGDFNMAANVPYEFMHNGTCWVEIRTSA
jgi:hypothetical protein